MITIIGGGDLLEEKGMTVAALDKILSADTVIYQTNRQGCYKEGALSLDDIFDKAQDFDEFAQKAAEFIGGHKGETVFVAVGDGVNSNVSARLCELYQDIEIIEGHICGCVATAAATGKLSFGEIFYINAYDYLSKPINTGADNVILGIDDSLLFWDIKAKLLDYYPPQTRIFINRTECNLEEANYKEPCDIFLPRLDILEKKRYSYDDFMNVVKELRQKCPWDREQTHKSIRTNLIEEAYELYEAIDKDDCEMMLEEMGDVLLQVGLHNVFECEHGDVTEDDVTTLICQKLIRRHPHVYGEAVCQTEAEVKTGWDDIKKQEYSLKTREDELRHISSYLPPLMRAYKTIKKARKNNITLEGNITDIINKLENGEDITNNCGKLLMLSVKLIMENGEHPHICLNDLVNTFIDNVDEREKSCSDKDGEITIDINTLANPSE